MQFTHHDAENGNGKDGQVQFRTNKSCRTQKAWTYKSLE
jgi:hypothetical protein